MSFKVLQYCFNIIILISFSLFFNACGAKPVADTRENSFAITTQKPSSILKNFNTKQLNLSVNSALHSLSNPTDALAARIFLIENAQTSLDVQYYIYEKDKTGIYFSKKLIQAADRGVKVRILLDDLSTTNRDSNWIELASHKNIELRLFNPNRFRTSLRNMALLLNVDTLGKRMHNKALIADSSVAIIGGRNIGDIYFAADKTTLFIDYDALIIGEVVPDIYNQFDIFYNSKLSVDYKDILDKYLLKAKKTKKNQSNNYSIKDTLDQSNFIKSINTNTLQMTEAVNTDFYFDLPNKVLTPDDDISNNISNQMYNYMSKATNSLIIVSPYFIPSDMILEKLSNLRDKGVEITIITNSLSSLDFFGVYSGYKNNIETILNMNINLYEIKSKNFKKFLKFRVISEHKKATIHTKMMIIDNTHLIIGSANIDNRSDKLNTELLLVVSSYKLANERTKHITNNLDTNYFYQLKMQEVASVIDYGIPRNEVVWHTTENGKQKIYYDIPNASFWKVLGANILSYIPIEGYL